MAEQTHIEWTDHTFNPWWGCTKVDPACDHCYAADMAHRVGWDVWGRGTPRRRMSAAYWRQPYKWDRQAAVDGVRRKVFCASMADVFDAEVPDEWRADLWQVIRDTPHLDWLLLTKRPNLIRRYLPADWGPQGWAHVWLGTTVGWQAGAWRADQLRATPAAVRFLSCEPLLGPLALDLDGIQWLIAGGESGPHYRPLDLAWVRSLRDQCQTAGVAFFFKQVGGRHPSSGGCLLDGREHKAFPAAPQPPPQQPSLWAS
jgi:protein gp37